MVGVLRALLSVVLGAALLPALRAVAEDTNLLANPSFETVKERDRNGQLIADWYGLVQEGDCRFEVGQVARTGARSALLACGSQGKARISQSVKLDPGRYEITAYLRGLDIGTGMWNQTIDFAFNGKYVALKKNGTFGWSKLTYVADLTAAAETGPMFRL